METSVGRAGVGHVARVRSDERAGARRCAGEDGSRCAPGVGRRLAGRAEGMLGRGCVREGPEEASGNPHPAGPGPSVWGREEGEGRGKSVGMTGRVQRGGGEAGVTGQG